SKRVSLSVSSQHSVCPVSTQSPPNVPARCRVVPISGAWDPLRARQVKAPLSGSIRATAEPDAFVEVSALWTIAANASCSLSWPSFLAGVEESMLTSWVPEPSWPKGARFEDRDLPAEKHLSPDVILLFSATAHEFDKPGIAGCE